MHNIFFNNQSFLYFHDIRVPDVINSYNYSEMYDNTFGQ